MSDDALGETHDARRATVVRPFSLRAVLFDFDGTLTRPGALDFAGVKGAIGCPADQYVLEWTLALPAGERRDACLNTLQRFELAGASASVPNHGAEELIGRLQAAGLAIGILTRNGRAAIDRALDRFETLTADDFAVIVTRDDGHLAPKPAPDGVLHAAAAMGVAPEEMLLVGDVVLDVRAGQAAGAVTAFLTNRATPAGEGAPVGDITADFGDTPAGDPSTDGGADVTDADLALREAGDADFVIAGLDEIDEVVRLGLPLPQGKLPNDLLAGFLATAAAGADPAVVVPPRVGEDVAAVDIAGAELLVVHGDPITLGGDAVAHAAVAVNINDIATSGASPRWLLATVLLPQGTTASQALTQLAELNAAADENGVTLIGGHSEITDAVTRPVVSLTALGTVERAKLRDKRSARRGDRVLVTKELALEGTALLAEELGERLRALGMDEAELAACRKLGRRLSIVAEATVAAAQPGVRSMHDITEGGVATAVRELGAAAGRRITVYRDRLPISRHTLRVCTLLDADPLGLIASGSLLIICDPTAVEELTAALAAAGIAVTAIGEVGEEGAGVVALEHGRPAPWPTFAVDEAARLLAPAGED